MCFHLGCLLNSPNLSVFPSLFKVQNGAVVIPKSLNKNHLQENFNIFDFTLSNADMQTLHSLNNNNRVMDFPLDKDDKFYPFNTEFWNSKIFSINSLFQIINQIFVFVKKIIKFLKETKRIVFYWTSDGFFDCTVLSNKKDLLTSL